LGNQIHEKAPGTDTLFIIVYEGISRYFEGTLAQYISGSTEWINLKFGGNIEYLFKFMCEKIVVIRYKARRLRWHAPKVKKIRLKKQRFQKIFLSQARLNIAIHLDVVCSSY
jgi:hypothetical protein